MHTLIRTVSIFFILISASISAASYLYGGVSSRTEPARAQASGGAGVAVSKDPSLMMLNPGILPTCIGNSLSLGAQRGTAADILSQLQWTSSLMGGVVSTGMAYYTAGNAEYWLPNGTTTTISLQRDTMLIAGWGRNVFDGMGVGLDVKAISSELAGTANSWGVGADLGMHMVFNETINGGLSFQNLGSAVKWGRDSMAQPALVRIGTAALFPVRQNMMGDPADFLQLMQDVSYSFLDGIFMSSTGAEYQWNNAAFMRIGLRAGSRSELTGFSAGAGIRTALYRLDYAAWLGSPVEMPHILTITFFIP